MDLRKEFKKQTGTRLPMTRTMEAYATYYRLYAEWLETQLKNCNLQNVNARAFVESCGEMTEYVDGTKIAKRFTKFTIPVIEYNELRQAADKWDSEHVR